jgi:hypothetical protein
LSDDEKVVEKCRESRRATPTDRGVLLYAAGREKEQQRRVAAAIHDLQGEMAGPR